MRYQGKITKWNHDRGFGFITPNGGGVEVFLHISSFNNRNTKPNIGQLVTYEIVQEPKGKKAVDVMMVGVKPEGENAIDPPGWFFKVLSIIILLSIAYYIYLKSPTSENTFESSRDMSEVIKHEIPISQFQCNGKTHCTEMTSCEEAMFYQKNCPGTQMDGDNDDIPCEQQFCH